MQNSAHSLLAQPLHYVLRALNEAGAEMKYLDRKLIQIAKKRHQTIYPCGNKSTFSACFTTSENKRLFWYNTPDQSTHVVSSDDLENSGIRQTAALV